MQGVKLDEDIRLWLVEIHGFTLNHHYHTQSLFNYKLMHFDDYERKVHIQFECIAVDFLFL